MSINVYVDGSCNPNPGGKAYVGVFIPKQESFDHEEKYRGFIGFGDGMSNNHAEYKAVVAALKLLYAYQDAAITIHTDSKLVANQMNGNWIAKEGAYIAAYREAVKERKSFKQLLFKWIPREDNCIADDVSKGILE